MTGRRGHGEGSVYFDQRRELWVGRMPRDEQGHRPVVYGTSRREVQKKLRDLLHGRERGLPVFDQRTRLGDYLDWWLAEVVAYEVSPKTAQSYEQHVRLHIKPALAQVPLATLDPKRVREVFNAKLREGLAPASVTRIRAVLQRALNDAVRDGYVARNVVTLVKRPKAVHRDPVVFTEDELGRVLKAAQDDALYLAILLAARTGMRMGEVLGLRWVDVDLEIGVLAVRQALQYVAGEGLQMGEPKSAMSRRTIPLAPQLVEELRGRRAEEAEDRRPDGLVFTTATGAPVYPGNLTRSWKRVLGRAGVEPRGFHTLRRTYATLLASRGVHPKAAQALLGHSSPVLTLAVYTAASSDMLRDAAATLEDAFDS
ncbi:MAG: site-specific integrase [Actinomycetota bacterium]|nr:site-specific integrase [Actinomycetota bacterium]